MFLASPCMLMLSVSTTCNTQRPQLCHSESRLPRGMRGKWQHTTLEWHFQQAGHVHLLGQAQLTLCLSSPTRADMRTCQQPVTSEVKSQVQMHNHAKATQLDLSQQLPSYIACHRPNSHPGEWSMLCTACRLQCGPHPSCPQPVGYRDVYQGRHPQISASA
jgi:hypothetical protein